MILGSCCSLPYFLQPEDNSLARYQHRMTLPQSMFPLRLHLKDDSFKVSLHFKSAFKLKAEPHYQYIQERKKPILCYFCYMCMSKEISSGV